MRTPTSLLLFTLALTAHASPSAPPKQEAAEADESEGGQPEFPFKPGPFTAEPGHEVQVVVPEGYVFLGMPHAAEFMKRNGSFHSEGLLGVILPAEETMGDWAAVLRHEDEGHIADDEKIDGDELLSAFKEAAPEMNEERVANGFPALDIMGWKEAPHYESATHQLVWGLRVQASGSKSESLNYNTRVLGRTGYVSLNFVTDVQTFEADRPHAIKLLAGTTFKPGAQYADFQKGRDKVAEYGLTGLILGGAGLGLAKVAKVGLFAKFFKVIIAGILGLKKAIIPLFIGLAALVKRLFGRKASSSDPTE